MSAPKSRPRARSGTVSADRRPSSSKIDPRELGVGAAASIISRVMRDVSCDSPVRMTTATPARRRIGRIAAVELEPELDLARSLCSMRRCGSVSVTDVDRAPVGQPRHHQPRQPLERLLGVERLGEEVGRVGEEAGLGLAPARLGDVDERRHRADHAPGRVKHRPRAQVDAAAGAVRELDVDLLALDDLPGREAARDRPVAHLEPAPVGMEGDVRADVGDRLRPRRRRPPDLGRARVHRDDVAGRSLGDRHADRKLMHQRLQALTLRLGGLEQLRPIERLAVVLTDRDHHRPIAALEPARRAEAKRDRFRDAAAAPHRDRTFLP